MTDAVIAPSGIDVLSSTVSRRVSSITTRLRLLAKRSAFRSLLVYALLAIIPNFPVWPGDPNRIATCACGGASDPNQTVWFLAWMPYALLHGHNPFLTDYINYPTGVDLAQNTDIPLLGLISALLTLLVNPVASLNLLRWLAFVLSAFAAYYVARKFVRFAPAAFVCGLLYGFSPYMVTQGSVHLDLAFAPLPPLILYGLFELVVRQQQSARKWGLITGICGVAQFFISAEVLATTAIVASIGTFFIFFLCIKQVPSHYRHALFGLSIATVILAIAIGYPAWLMFHAPQHYIGPAQGYNEVYNADLLGPVLPTAAQLVAPEHLATIGSNLVGGKGNLDENGSYLGIPLLVIAIYFVLRYWRRMWMAYVSLLGLTIFALSLGPYLYVDGKFHHLPFNLPFRKINHFPGINNILPVRFSLYVMLFIALIVALGIDFYRDDVVARRERDCLHPPTTQRTRLITSSRIGGVVVALAALVSLVPRWPYQSRPTSAHYAQTAAGLAVIPSGSTVLAYPYPTPFADDAMVWQALSGMRFKLLGSYALIPSHKRTATIFPDSLTPSIVEAMLANGVTPQFIPTLPVAIATKESFVATSVTVIAPGTKVAHTAHSMTGIVATVLHRKGFFVLNKSPAFPVTVRTSATTRYVGTGKLPPRLSSLHTGERVIISGHRAEGTVNAATVQLLRRYVAINKVNAIVVALGRRDSGAIAKWMKMAFGRPTQAGGGGLIWVRPTPLGAGQHLS